MSRVLALVEGPTEQAFVRDILAPALASAGVYLSARLIGKPGHEGGIRRYEAAQRELRMLLHEDAARLVTTMLDYSGMPSDWPGRAAASSLPVPNRAEAGETAIAQDFCARMGDSFDPRRFIPYVQLHEFEAILFAGPSELAEAAQSPNAARPLQEIADEFGNPEAIDDGVDTYPSKRIAAHIPGYQKVLHGPIAAEKIGLGAIRARCAHFAAWVCRLESLAQG